MEFTIQRQVNIFTKAARKPLENEGFATDEQPKLPAYSFTFSALR